VARGRKEHEAGSYAAAMRCFEEALSLEPDSREAAELLWRAGRKAQRARARPPDDPEAAKRLVALLEEAAPEVSESEARHAIAELALIAPDDPRVVALMRQRSEH
jgi:hypothetical protein